jgi:hypothetical protein
MKKILLIAILLLSGCAQYKLEKLEAMKNMPCWHKATWVREWYTPRRLTWRGIPGSGELIRVGRYSPENKSYGVNNEEGTSMEGGLGWVLL